MTSYCHATKAISQLSLPAALYHSELLRPGHLRCLDGIGLHYLNLGENQYLTPHEVLENTRVPFAWNVKTATMAQGTPDMIRDEFLAATGSAPGRC